ncbi:MAG: cytochrome c oxidase, subunit [Phycisphaerales bacterium]|nr:cytochrome c oxidase, subunit [Phycisphaerales bacterium]
METRSVIRKRSSNRHVPPALFLAGFSVLALMNSAAHAAGSPATLVAMSGNDWWLNTNYAAHGGPMDQIFVFIFWLTTVILVGVQAVLVWFLIKYRHRKGRTEKGVYTHGNARLEIMWTLIPAVILIVLALWTKRVWDNYRYSPIGNDPNAVKILVIGEQFKWNVIYPGPTNKIGRYLLYPKPTDLKWPTLPDGKSFDYEFPKVPGPAYLPEEQARQALDKFLAVNNPLGRDFSDPDTNPDPTGKDDELASLNNYGKTVGRVIVIPKGRPVEIQLGSRDVIHDFFLPNFRVKLDVVPGMRGRMYIRTTDDCPGPREYTLEELRKVIQHDHYDALALINKDTPKADYYRPNRRKPGYYRFSKDGQTVLRENSLITLATLDELKAAGVDKLPAAIAYDLVCEELCGIGHATMQGKLIVLDEAWMKEAPYKYYFPPPVTEAAGKVAMAGN